MRWLRKKTKNFQNINKLKDMEIYYLSDREFKIAVLKKLNKMQQNTDRQFNELRNQINK